MKDALSRALGQTDEGEGDNVDRILAAAFFRKRPLQAGSSAHVIQLAERRVERGSVDPKDRDEDPKDRDEDPKDRDEGPKDRLVGGSRR